MMSLPLKARVHNGRLVLDEPTDLPEGEEVLLLPMDETEDDELDEAQRAALHRALERAHESSKAGRVVDAEVVLAKLRARRTGP